MPSSPRNRLGGTQFTVYAPNRHTLTQSPSSRPKQSACSPALVPTDHDAASMTAMPLARPNALVIAPCLQLPISLALARRPFVKPLTAKEPGAGHKYGGQTEQPKGSQRNFRNRHPPSCASRDALHKRRPQTTSSRSGHGDLGTT